MDFVKKAQEFPVVVAVGAVLGALALLGGAWQFFSTETSAFEALVGAVTYAFTTGAVVALFVAVGLLASMGALVAVVVGSVRNRKLAQHLSGELVSRTAERDGLKSLIATMADQSAKLEKELQETKHSIAIDSMRRHSMMKFSEDGTTKPKVTIRCADYKADYDLAKKIKETIREHTGWTDVEVDASNKPSLERADKFKVMFESGWAQTFDRLAHDFAVSELLGIAVGRRSADRADHHHLIIFVYPSP